MKGIGNRIVIALAVASLLPILAFAQSREATRARALYVKKQSDGVEIKVLQKQSGRFDLVEANKEFGSGDEIRLRFQGNFKGQIYLINVTPGGVTRVIYHSQINAGSSFELPAEPEVMAFDKEPGTEILKVVMSRALIPAFDKALKDSQGELGLSARSVAEELANTQPSHALAQALAMPPAKATASEPVGIVSQRCRGLELAPGKEMRCRGLTLAPGKREKDEGTVVAISDRQGSKLRPGDVAVFELRFKHVAR